ncbi:MAG: DNA-protecting protein DprA [Patescibacteria group bacterium]|nr:DNA-protecting protein DprA [Patescibacteria group bacterium]
MKIKSDNDIFAIDSKQWPTLLHQLPYAHRLESLYCLGIPPPVDGIYLTVVGSRQPTDYGRDCVFKLIEGLANYPITIVSGLAHGIDGLAHEAALKVGLKTLAFPGSGLARHIIYPAAHLNLADRIIDAGGCLLSEWGKYQEGTDWSFPRRNRLMAGISKVTVIIEGRLKSGSLITTTLAHDFNRTVMAVPGPINSPFSAGPNMLIKTPTAIPVTSSDDILVELGFEPRPIGEMISPERIAALDPTSQKIMRLLLSGQTNKDRLCRELDIPIHELNPLLSFLEIDGMVKSSGNMVRRLG